MPNFKRRHRTNCNEPGHAHALTFTCYKGYPFLESERTCGWLKDAIDAARTALDFVLWAYVFMPEHVHLVLWPRQAIHDIAYIRQAIKEPVGRRGMRYFEQNAPAWLARVTRRRGRKTERLFWQSGGGYGRNITSTKVLLWTIDYIHMNPVRRGLVAQAVDWKWSSAAWYVSQQPTPIAIDPIPTEWMSL